MRQKWFKNNNIIWSVRILISFLFLLSAVSKLYPSPNFALTTFEIKQLLPMGFSEYWAAYFSRTLIGCELALGILLLQNHYYKKLVLPISFLLLFIFSSHLTYEIIATGNEGNCGCFGSLLPMSPLQALIKNIIAMALLGYLYKQTESRNEKKNFSFVMAITFASILLIYLVGPLRQKSTIASAVTPVMVEEIDTVINVKIDSTATDKKEIKQINGEEIEKEVVEEPKAKNSGYKKFFADIDKGRKVLCFFAPGCDHCQETARELTKLKKQIKDFPDIRVIFMDEEANLIPDFFSKAGASYPHLVLDVASFWTTLGGSKDTPGVLYLWNGNLMKEYDGINEKKFKMDEFKSIVKKSYKELK